MNIIRARDFFPEFTQNNEESSVAFDTNAENLNMFLAYPDHLDSVLTKENIKALKVFIQMCSKAYIMDDKSEVVP